MCFQLHCVAHPYQSRSDHVQLPPTAPIIGSLCDMFCCSFAFHVKGSVPPRYYISQRVTDPEEYVLVSLLWLCGLEGADIAHLMQG
jgi:hypothetical protein